MGAGGWCTGRSGGGGQGAGVQVGQGVGTRGLVYR